MSAFKNDIAALDRGASDLRRETTTIATPQKLRSGEWGARVQGTARTGDTITIRTRSGKEWQTRVTRVVWSGEGVSIVATQSVDRPSTGGGGAQRVWDPHKFRGYGAARGGYVRACKTGGNCSSFGSGRSCGGYDCDGF